MPRSELDTRAWAWTGEDVLGNFQDIFSLLQIFLPTPGSALLLNWNHPVLSMLNPILRGSPFPSLSFLPACLQLSVTAMGSGTCCLPVFNTSFNWNIKSLPHRLSYFSHFLHKHCVKCWDLPLLHPSTLWWVFREILHLKIICSIAVEKTSAVLLFFSLVWDSISSFLLILIWKCWKFCFQNQRWSPKMSTSSSSPEGSVSSASLDDSYFICFTIIPCSFLLFTFFICWAVMQDCCFKVHLQ